MQWKRQAVDRDVRALLARSESPGSYTLPPIVAANQLDMKRDRCSAASLTVAIMCLCALLVSCAPTIPVEQKQFEATVAELLRNSNEVVVPAEKIAAFPWQRLCFERLNEVVLTFEDADSALTMRFDYRKIFIDDAYVAGSPEKECITRQTPLRLKRMYPGNAETIGIYLDRQ